MPKVALPMWILIALPAVWALSLISAIVFRSHPAIVQISLLATLFSTVTAFVVVPASFYAMIANPALRTSQQITGIALCAIPILGIFASFLSGGI